MKDPYSYPETLLLACAKVFRKVAPSLIAREALAFHALPEVQRNSNGGEGIERGIEPRDGAGLLLRAS